MQTADSVLRAVESPRPAAPFVLRQSTVPPPQRQPRAPREERPGALPDVSRLPHSLPVRVYGDDLNSRGFAGAPALVRFMDRARHHAIEDVCAAAGVRSWLEEYVVNVYRIEAHGAPSAKMNHVLDMRTGLRRISSHRAAFDQVAINTTTGAGEVAITAVVEVLFLNQDRVLVPVPESFPAGDGPGGTLPQKHREHVEFSDDSAFPFRSRFRVYYEDTDLQGITFHAAYVRFCERALLDLARSAWPEMSMTSWTQRNRVNVSRMDIRYLKATRVGDRLEVRTGARRLDPLRIALEQRIVLAATGQVVADAVTEVESRDLDERVAPIPAQLVDGYYEALPPTVDDG
jgi:acyl-CoA thioester hydrolase